MIDLEKLAARDAGKLRVFCPLMGEWCTKGWTPKMGKESTDPESLPLFGACGSWQPVTVQKPGEPARTFHACATYETTPMLLAELVKETAYAGAGADKVANEVADFHATSIAVMPETAREALARARPRLTGKFEPAALEHKTNGA